MPDVREVAPGRGYMGRLAAQLEFVYLLKERGMVASTEEKILERLDQILRVLAVQVGEGLSITERARVLKLVGLDNQTIATVLNTTPGTIRSLTANLGRKRTSAKPKASA
jgi:hypothetical protein